MPLTKSMRDDKKIVENAAAYNKLLEQTVDTVPINEDVYKRQDDGDQDVAGGSTKVGLGITVSLSATEATEDADGNAQQDGTAAAVLLDSEGKIVKCLVDVAQNKMAFTSEGVVLDKDKDFITKKNLKEDYGMGPVSPLSLIHI